MSNELILGLLSLAVIALGAALWSPRGYSAAGLVAVALGVVALLSLLVR